MIWLLMAVAAVVNAVTGQRSDHTLFDRQVADIERFFKYPAAQTISG
jgi:hypothetical protein